MNFSSFSKALSQLILWFRWKQAQVKFLIIIIIIIIIIIVSASILFLAVRLWRLKVFEWRGRPHTRNKSGTEFSASSFVGAAGS